MGVPYGPRALSGSEAFQAATKNWKAEVSKKPTMKKVNAGLSQETTSKIPMKR
jgi:hypothetical protein